MRVSFGKAIKCLVVRERRADEQDVMELSGKERTTKLLDHKPRFA